MRPLNQFCQEHRWLFGTKRTLFDSRTRKIKSPFCLVSGSYLVGFVAATLLLMGSSAHAANYTWNTTSATWNTTATNWTGSGGGTNPWDITNGGTNNATFTVSGANTVTVSGIVYANQINKTDSAGTTTLSSGTITLAGSAPSITNNGTSGLSISSKISGSNGVVVTLGSGAGATGSVTFSGANDYSGTTTINGANNGLTVTNNAGLGTSAVLVNANGTLKVATSALSNNITLNGGASNGAIQASANSTLSGLITLASNATIGNRVSSGNTTLTLSGGINTTGGANQTLILNTLASSTSINNAITINSTSVNLGTGGTLDIGGGIASTGTGTVNLNVGNNTWGTIIVRAVSTAGVSSNATLNLGAANALGGSGAVLQLGNSNTALEGITVNLNGNNQTIGGLRSFGSTGSASANGTRTITSATTATLTIDNSSATNYLYEGVISGGISLVKNGTATQTLAGNNTYTGATTVNAGTLSTGSADRISDSSAVTVASGATLLLGGSETVSSIAGAGNYSIAGFTLTAGGDNTSTEVSGNITGASGALTKSGAGTLVLSGNNTYTGATTINAGTLEIASTGRLGGGSYSGNINNNGTLTFNGSSAQTLSGIISGFGGLTKNNTSTLTLSGANTYTGNTSVNAGTLAIGNAGALGGNAGVTVASGALVQFTAIGTYSNNFTIAGNGGANGVFQASANSTLSGLITLASNATIGNRASSGNTTLTLSGGINTTGGANQTLILNTLASSTAINNAITINSTSMNLGTGGTLDIGGGIASTGSGTVNLNVGNNTWGTLVVRASASTGVSSNATLNLGAANALGGSGAVVQLGNSNAALEGITVNLNGNNQTIGGLRSFGSTGSASANGTRTITSATAATLAIDNSSATNYLYDGVISGGISLVKNGSATQTLSGNNTYTGPTTISNGALVFQNTAAKSGSSIVTVAAAGTLGLGVGNASIDYSNNVADVFNNGTLTGFTIDAASGIALDTTNGNFTLSNALTAARALTKLGSNTLTLSGNNTYAGTTTVSAGTLEISTAGQLGGGSYAQNIINNGAFLYNGTNSQTLSGIISGSGALTKNNAASTIILSGNNTYTGGTTVSAGVLNIQNANALGSTANGTTVSSGAALQLQGGITVGTESLSLSGTGVSTTGALRNISGSNTYGGAITLAAATRINSDADLLTLSGGINGTHNLTIGGLGNTTANSDIATSTGTLTKDGVGTLTLSGNNTYTGATTVSGGILQFAKTASLYNATTASWTASNITVNNGATLALNVGGAGEFSLGNVTSLLTGLGGLGGAVNNNGLRSGSSIGFDTTNAGSSLTISDVIANSTGTGGGTIGVTKLGTGALVLSGNNTYTGATTISAGTLEIASTGRLGGGSYSGNINNNGTLTFNGSSAQTLSGIISGSGGLTKNNTSSLTLSGGNTYTGNTSVNAGTLAISNAGALGGNAGVTVASGALVQFNATGIYSNNFTIAGNGGANGVFQVAANSTLSGLITLASNATIGNRASSGNTTLTFSGGINTTGGANQTLILNTLASSTAINNAITINSTSVNLGTGGTLDIGAGIASTGTGTVNLNVGNNTWGTMVVRASASSGVSSNAMLNLGAANALGGSGAVVQLGNSNTALEGITVNLNGNSQTIGGLRSFGSTGSASANGTRTVTSATAATLTIDNSSATNYLYDGVISGSVSLVKNGAATQILAGNNTYSGATTVNAGTLLLSGNGTLGTSTISISGGTLDMGGKSLTNTFGSLTGGTLSNGTLTNNGGNYDLQNGTISAVLAGTNGVNKTTSGTVTLQSANTYTGTTTVNNGTLTANSANALGGTTNIDLHGGSLLVTAANSMNVINDSANINLKGGRLAVNGTFDESVGALTLSKDSIIDFSGFVGTLRFSGVGSWTSGANLAIWNWSGTTQYGTQINNYQTPSNLVFTNNSTLSSNLANISFYSDSGNSFIGNGFEVSGFTGGGSQIIAVPEPETVITAVILLLGFTFYQIRLARHGQGLLSRLTFLRCTAQRKPFEDQPPA